MTRDQGEVFLHLGYATVRDFGLPGVSVRGGRFGYNNGLEKLAKDPSLLWLQRLRISQRLIGNFDYTNVGRSFDGAQAIYDHGPFNLTLMASHPTAGGYNVNANKEISKSRPGLGHRITDRAGGSPADDGAVLLHVLRRSAGSGGDRQPPPQSAARPDLQHGQQQLPRAQLRSEQHHHQHLRCRRRPPCRRRSRQGGSSRLDRRSVRRLAIAAPYRLGLRPGGRLSVAGGRAQAVAALRVRARRRATRTLPTTTTTRSFK